MSEANSTSKQANSAWLSPGDVCDMIAVGLKTVYELMHTGELPYIELGPHTRRIRRSDVDAMLTRKFEQSAQRVRIRRSARSNVRQLRRKGGE